MQSNFNFVFEWKHVEADGHVVFNRLLFTAVQATVQLLLLEDSASTNNVPQHPYIYLSVHRCTRISLVYGKYLEMELEHAATLIFNFQRQ